MSVALRAFKNCITFLLVSSKLGLDAVQNGGDVIAVDVERLRALAVDVLTARGTPLNRAQRVVQSLLLADRKGVATHGLGLFPLYCELIDAAVIDPAAQPGATRLGDSLGRVDGQRAFGQLSGELAVDLGCDLLARHGIAAVGIYDGTHLGRLGEWAERACGHGAVFLAFTNTSGGARNVAGPSGGRRLLSTNPLAIGVPTFDGCDPVIVDFASSQVSGSRIREAANAGGELDPDWLVGDDGVSAADPQAFLSGRAALRPLGGRSAGHKGFGLMVASEMLAALAGAMMAGERNAPWFSNGALFCFLDAARYVEPGEWAHRCREFRDYLAARDCRLPGSRPPAAVDGPLMLAPHTLASLVDIARTCAVDTRGLQDAARGAGVTRTW